MTTIKKMFLVFVTLFILSFILSCILQIIDSYPTYNAAFNIGKSTGLMFKQELKILGELGLLVFVLRYIYVKRGRHPRNPRSNKFYNNYNCTT